MNAIASITANGELRMPPSMFPDAPPAFIEPDHLDPDRNRPVFARIFLPDEPGGLRTLFGSAHRHAIAINRDPKTGHPNPTDGVTERDLSMLCASHPDVVDYQPQGLRMEMMVSTTPRSWLADAWILWRNGTLELVEVKTSEDSLDDPDYLAKLWMAAWVCERLGWRFRVRYRNSILRTPERRINIANLHFDRAATIDEHHWRRFERLRSAGDQVAFGDLVDELDPADPAQALAVAHRMVCMGRVWTDLDELLCEDSDVTLRGPATVVSPLRNLQ